MHAVHTVLRASSRGGEGTGHGGLGGWHLGIVGGPTPDALLKSLSHCFFLADSGMALRVAYSLANSTSVSICVAACLFV